MRLVALFVVLTASLALGGGASADPPLLVGTVGPFFTIDVEDAAGTHVTHLEPGTYTLLVHDLSAGHNFHLWGAGGVDVVVTTPEFVGDQTVPLTLVTGTYAYQCDLHPGQMTGGFTVGDVPVTTTIKKPVAKKPAPKHKPKKHKPKPKKKR
jgi:hypothetical protein